MYIQAHGSDQLPNMRRKIMHFWVHYVKHEHAGRRMARAFYKSDVVLYSLVGRPVTRTQHAQDKVSTPISLYVVLFMLDVYLRKHKTAESRAVTMTTALVDACVAPFTNQRAVFAVTRGLYITMCGHY